MKILAVSGSVRSESTNTQLLRALSYLSPLGVANLDIDIFSSHDKIPVFNPDLEGVNTPPSVLALCQKISMSDGVIISSPEYIRSIPGGLKNSIDWLVSRNEIIKKPIALVHASHRGGDVLKSLRRVLSTVSEHFTADVFLQLPLIGMSQAEVKQEVNSAKYKPKINEFLIQFVKYIESVNK